MKLIEIANLANKKSQTVAMFFARHNLSRHSDDDVRFYLQHLQSGKRIERGLRSTEHLKKYRFQPKSDRLQKARELVKNRKLIWGTARESQLSDKKIVESVLSHGDWSDVLEIIRLFGKQKVAEIFQQQINQPRTNYRPQTLNFFHIYFNLPPNAS
ncbi:hypothetical protein KKF38_02980 [Patescibacteria group bacterium]|nr:hypothetical protein [Patescibacteria group bacterium]